MSVAIPPDIQRLLDWADTSEDWELYAHRLEYIVDRLLIDLDATRSASEHYYCGFEMLLKKQAEDKFRDL